MYLNVEGVEEIDLSLYEETSNKTNLLPDEGEKDQAKDINTKDGELPVSETNHDTKAENHEDFDVIDLGQIDSNIDYQEKRPFDTEINNFYKKAQNKKWSRIRRVARALGIRRGRSASKSDSACEGLDDDTISLDGHLFEYRSQCQIVPRTEVPRLRLKKTLKERVVSTLHRLFPCLYSRAQYEYSDS